MKCYFQRRDAIPVLEEEVEETYCPGVSVFRGKVINLDEDDHSSQKTMVPKKAPIFHKVFLIGSLLLKTETFHFTLPEK